MSKNILIIDSGIGGISIYKKIKIILPYNNYIYILDNNAFPYGEKKKEFIINRILKILNKILYKHKIDVVIIACNTASIACLKELKNFFQFKILKIIPNIKSAISTTKNKIIGLLATKFTINNSYIKNKIKKLSNDYKFILLPSSKLVLLSERKFIGNRIKTKKLKIIIKPFTNLKQQPDTIILGCTHFSIFYEDLKKILQKNIKIIDSNNIIIKKIQPLKTKHNLIHKKQIKNIIYFTKFNQNIKKIKKILIKIDFKHFKYLDL